MYYEYYYHFSWLLPVSSVDFFFFFFFFWFGFYGPFKNISLISSRSFIKGGRKPENPEVPLINACFMSGSHSWCVEKNKYHLLTHLVIIRVYTVTKATGHLRLTETTPRPPPPINTCQYGSIIALFTAEYYRSCPNFGGYTVLLLWNIS